MMELRRDKIRLMDFDPGCHMVYGFESNRGNQLFHPQLTIEAGFIASEIDAQSSIGLLKSLLEEDSNTKVVFTRIIVGVDYSRVEVHRPYRLKNISLLVEVKHGG